MFFNEYAKAHVKASELGQEANLISEFEPHHQDDGGYVEPSLIKNLMACWVGGYNWEPVPDPVVATVKEDDHH